MTIVTKSLQPEKCTVCGRELIHKGTERTPYCPIHGTRGVKK